jgi:acetolactate synthase-1/2/3 large subunit
MAFSVAGESYLEVLDALFDAPEIRLVTCRQEGGAAFMAEAYGKLTGKPGVLLVTRGPGACNASIGIHTAFQDSTPMVVLVGQVARHQIDREAFQEVDFRKMFAPLAKWVAQIDMAERVPELINQAFQVATSGRPGPVVLALPEDMLRDRCAAAVVGPYRPCAYPGATDLARCVGFSAPRNGLWCWSAAAAGTTRPAATSLSLRGRTICRFAVRSGARTLSTTGCRALSAISAPERARRL